MGCMYSMRANHIHETHEKYLAWKGVPERELEDVLADCRTGDVFLNVTEPRSQPSTVANALTGTPWAHAGLIVRHEDMVFVVDAFPFQHWPFAFEPLAFDLALSISSRGRFQTHKFAAHFSPSIIGHEPWSE